MPRIPTIDRKIIQSPTVNVNAVTAPFQAQAQMGQAVANLGNTIGDIYSDIQTKRRATADLVNLATAQNSLEEFKFNLAEGLGNETDFNNIKEETIDEQINTFTETYSKMFENSPEAGLKFNNMVEAASRELKKVAYARHDTLVADQAKLNTEKYLDRETLNYVNADPEQQKEIIDNVNLYVNGMADNNAYSKTYAYDRSKKWLEDANAQIEKNQSKRDAYEVDAIVQKANTMVVPEKSDEPYNLEARYAEVEKLTDNPTFKKAAYDELTRLKKIHDDAQKERYDSNVNQIVGAFQSGKYVTVNDIKKLPAYADLSETQRGIVEGKIQNLIDQRDREERSVAAAERAADTAERARIKAEQDAQEAKYDKAYDKLMSNQKFIESLGTMDQTAFDNLVLDVGEKNQSRLVADRIQAQKSDKSSDPYTIRTNTINAIFAKTGITDDTEKILYRDAVRVYVGDETDPAIIRKKVAEAMQNKAMEYNWLGKPKKVTINAPK